MKYIKLLMLCITMVFIVSGCQNSEKKLSNKSSSYDTKTDVIQLNLKNDTYKELTHKSTSVIDLESFNLQSMNIPVDGTISSVSCIKDELIVEIYPENDTNHMEVGVFNPHTNTYKKIDRISFNAAYGKYSYILQERYFIMASCNESNEIMNGNILIYDIETDELKSIDEFEVHNIVQFITPVNNKGIAYFYYEAKTQDWVIKYYDIDKNVTNEIFRHTNFNDMQISPMAISSKDNDIAFIMQFIEDDIYHTQISWMTSEGVLYKNEEIDLYKFFGNEYEITDFLINNDDYYIKTKIQSEEEYFILHRENNDFHLVFPAICHLNNLLSNTVDDRSNILFYQNTNILGDLININLIDSSIATYEFSTDFLENKTIDCINTNENGDLFILYLSDNDEYTYQVITEYQSTATSSSNPGLYESPRQQYERYINSEHATREGIEELKKSTEKAEEQMCKNDFRWKFVLS